MAIARSRKAGACEVRGAGGNRCSRAHLRAPPRCGCAPALAPPRGRRAPAGRLGTTRANRPTRSAAGGHPVWRGMGGKGKGVCKAGVSRAGAAERPQPTELEALPPAHRAAANGASSAQARQARRRCHSGSVLQHTRSSGAATACVQRRTKRRARRARTCSVPVSAADPLPPCPAATRLMPCSPKGGHSSCMGPLPPRVCWWVDPTCRRARARVTPEVSGFLVQLPC